MIEDAPAVLRALREELERARRDEAARAGLPHFPLEALYLDEAELDRRALAAGRCFRRIARLRSSARRKARSKRSSRADSIRRRWPRAATPTSGVR